MGKSFSQGMTELLHGKILLVGINFCENDEEETLIEHYQTSGIIERVTEEGFIVIIRNDGSLFKIPYSPPSMIAATEGEYREDSTGKIIINPDFITSWTVVQPDRISIDKIKNGSCVNWEEHESTIKELMHYVFYKDTFIVEKKVFKD